MFASPCRQSSTSSTASSISAGARNQIESEIQTATSSISFNDIIGLEGAKQALREAVRGNNAAGKAWHGMDGWMDGWMMFRVTHACARWQAVHTTCYMSPIIMHYRSSFLLSDLICSPAYGGHREVIRGMPMLISMMSYLFRSHTCYRDITPVTVQGV